MLGCWCRAQSYKRHEHHKSPSAAQVSCTWSWFCQRCFLTSHLCVWVCVFGCSCVSGFVCQLSDEDNGLISVLALAPLCCVVTTCHYQKHRRWHTSVPELTSIQACKKQPPLQTHLKTHVLIASPVSHQSSRFCFHAHVSHLSAVENPFDHLSLWLLEV